MTRQQMVHWKEDCSSEDGTRAGFVDLSCIILKTPILLVLKGPIAGFAGHAYKQANSFFKPHANSCQAAFSYLRMSFNRIPGRLGGTHESE
ncbi:MAG: hypothetical protein CMJ40_00805 [Phycisphaerae bacterium]|nr:hypothetical protein [Phycisphaerae bacterium]